MSAKPRETDAATSQETLGSRIALLCRRALVRARVVCPLRFFTMADMDGVFHQWIDEARGGKVCPDELKPLLEGMYKASPLNFLSCIVKNREDSNPVMDTEVWRQVIEQAMAEAGVAKPGAMVALVGRLWAASPPDVTVIVTPSLSPAHGATLGSMARATSAGTAGEGPWGRELSADEIGRLNADARKDLEEQEAPGIDALVITAVSVMLGRKCGVSEAQGAQYRQDPMMAACFKQLAKLQSVSASKPLGKKIEEAKKQRDMTAIGTHMDKLGDSLVDTDSHGVAVARVVMKLWKDISTMDSSRPALGAFWLEMYLEKTLGRGLPPLWEQKMLFDATKAYDAYYKEEGNTQRPAPRSPDEQQPGQQQQAGGGFESKVLEKLDGVNRSIDGLRQSQDHLKSNFSRLDAVVKAMQRGEEPPPANTAWRGPGPCHRCGKLGHVVSNCPDKDKGKEKES